MLEPRATVETPPQPGWFWDDESVSPPLRISHSNYNVWLGKVHDRIASTGQFVGEGWKEGVLDWFCRHASVQCREIGKPEPRERTWSDYQQFANVAARHIESGGEMVPQEEAERRAAICVGCPKNVPISGMCASCKVAEVGSWIYRIIRGAHTSQDHSLMSCGICGCDTRLAVWSPLSVQRDDRFTADDFLTANRNCWKAKAYEPQ